MNSRYAVYRETMWQQKSSCIFDYTNLIVKQGMTVEEVAEKRNVPVSEVNSVLHVLKSNNPLLYEQVESQLNG